MEGKIPDSLKFECNLAENFRKFKQQFEIYMVATDKVKKADEVKIAVLLNIIGEEGVEIYNNFKLNDEDKINYKKVLQEFETYTKPKKNIIYERFLFYNRVQQENEPFDRYITDLKRLVKNCEFKEQEEDMARDRIVLGTNDKGVQEKLLTADGLNLVKAVEICRTSEVTKDQLRNVQEEKGLV